MNDKQLKEVETRYYAAVKVYNELKYGRSGFVREAAEAAERKAEAEWDAQYGDSLKAASTVQAELSREYDEAKVLSASAKSSLAGKHVYQATTERYSHKIVRYKEGIVEIATPQTEVSGNRRRPSIGSEFVRLLKADGTPGLAFDTWMSGWTTKKPVIG